MRRCFSCGGFNRPPLMHGRIRQKYGRVEGSVGGAVERGAARLELFPPTLG